MKFEFLFSSVTSYAAAAVLLMMSTGSGAQDTTAAALSADDVAERIYSRDEGEAVSRELAMELIDHRGKIRHRTATVYRRTVDGMKQKVIFFTGPRLVKDMAFLTHDFLAPEQQDRQWLYLPAMRKVRRIPASDRGDYFLGTDFTYNDVKDELKFEPADYVFSLSGHEQMDNMIIYHLSGRAKTAEVAAELGYTAFDAKVGSQSWIPSEIRFLDENGQVLKHVEVAAVEQVDEIWTPLEISAESTQSGHKTVFTYSSVSFSAELDDRLFSATSIKTGSGQ